MSSVAAQGRPAVRARHIVRTHFSEYPRIYLPFARLKYPGPSPAVIGVDTEMVIDGYTRSASTFAVYALQLAQDRPVRLAHHLHAPAQLVAAAQRRIPTLLVIREPRGAILSQVIREPGVAVRDALTAYYRFHALLVPWLDNLVVGEFETVTHDFGTVVHELNARFSLSLTVPAADHAEETFAFVEQRGSLSPWLLGFESGTVSREDARMELRRQRAQAGSVQVREQWRPSADRQRQKEELAAAWDHPRLARLRGRAERIYRTITSSGRAA